MNRSEFLKISGLLGAGTLFGAETLRRVPTIDEYLTPSGYKNIIFMVSDGMSIGTLTMADMLHRELYGKPSNWIQLYHQQRIQRALMDTASLNSYVTDSAAGSSAWGGGVRVNNGSLNVGPNGEKYTPILQKFKQAGKSVGCVTTVPVTHATPAGFCVNIDSRGEQAEIATIYESLGFDLFLGGGKKYFTTEQKDRELLQKFQKKNYHIAFTKAEMEATPEDKKVLGIFAEDALPYWIDHRKNSDLLKNVPSLAEMTRFALKKLSKNPNGFVVQIEGGKVDWAAHANDIGALLFDQLAFDAAIGEAIAFAEKRKDTLVVITTDHGNSNPGLLYGKKANSGFATIKFFSASNEFILSNISATSSIKEVKDLIFDINGFAISDEDAQSLVNHYTKLDDQELYNPRKLPFKKLAEIQSKQNNVGFVGMDHTADFVEFCVYGLGSRTTLPPFIKNFEVHQMMLQWCGVKTG